MARILVTGGAGYIGSHCCVELLLGDHEVVVLDNFSNSKPASLERVQRLVGRTLTLIRGDIRDSQCLDALFEAHQIDAVIHFAGLKAVGESTEKPLEYYDNNVTGTISLCAAMRRAGVKSLIFSSSATVYGDPASVPILEDFPRQATNPYGRSKLMIEDILIDLQRAESDWSVTLLRYFNPVGAHPSGELGEDPRGIPNNLLPYISQVAVGRLERLRVFGDDYPTSDGTGVRDYIHVVDLAQGHLAALERRGQAPGVHCYNLGTGQGVSVLAMRAAFEEACERPIPYEIVERRPGDIAECWADASRARQELGWVAKLSLPAIVSDAWRWQSKNPEGYPDSDPEESVLAAGAIEVDR